MGMARGALWEVVLTVRLRERLAWGLGSGGSTDGWEGLGEVISCLIVGGAVRRLRIRLSSVGRCGSRSFRFSMELIPVLTFLKLVI